MTIYIICAWYEVGMRSYSFTILNNIKKHLPDGYKIHVTLVLRENQENYPELAELEGLSINYVIIKNRYINILTKIFPLLLDTYFLKKTKEYKASIVYILFEGLSFKNIGKIQKHASVLFTVHDLIPHEKTLLSTKDKWLEETERKRRYYLSEKSDFVITNSIIQHEILNAKNNNAFYIGMPTLINNHTAAGKIKPRELNSTKYILFFGRIDKYKGLENLIKCHIDSQTETLLVIAGGGNYWFDLPHSKHILIINRYIKDEELNYLFKNSILTVLPYESVTQTALISLPFYFSSPVMFSNLPEFRSVSEESGSMICNFNNPEKYKYLITQIQTDTDIRNKIIDKQHLYYENNYNDFTFTKSLENIFARINEII